MTDAARDPNSAANAARRLLEASVEKRVQAVRTIVTAANETDAARVALTDAQSRHTKAWADALAAGWSEKELKLAGVPKPDQPRARSVRPRPAASRSSDDNSGA